MLPITIPATEFWDSKKREFINIKETRLQLEHSLISISKWESKWHKAFLDDRYEKTGEEILDYIKCMTVTPNVQDEVYMGLTKEDIDKIVEYIQDSMTATWFSDDGPKPRKKRILTSELLYFMMFQNNIPISCEKWHLNRLITLLKVCDAELNPKKKSRKQTAQDYAKLNERRLKEQAAAKAKAHV